MTISKHDRTASNLADLALRAAISLEFLAQGRRQDLDVVSEFSAALVSASNIASSSPSSHYFAGRYHRSFMRLANSADGPHTSVTDAQQMLRQRANMLRELLENPEGCKVLDLADFCISLHQELISTHLSELRIAKRRETFRRAPSLSRTHG